MRPAFWRIAFSMAVATFGFSFGGERIGQGRENTKAFLKEHPKVAAEIEKAVRQNAGLIVDKMLQASPEGDEAADAEEGPDGQVEDDEEAPGKKGARKKG